MIKKAIFLITLSVIITLSAHAQGGNIGSNSSPTVNRQGVPLPGINIAVCQPLATSGASVTSNIATLSFATSPITAGFAVGGQIMVSGFTGGDIIFNAGTLTNGQITGGWTIQAVTSSTIKFTLVNANYVASSNGTVLQEGSTTIPCGGLTPVYANPTLTTQVTQPFQSDQLGNWNVYGTPGIYYAQFYGTGYQTVIRQFAVACVPNSNCAGSGGGGSGGTTGTILTGNPLQLSAYVLNGLIPTLGPINCSMDSLLNSLTCNGSITAGNSQLYVGSASGAQQNLSSCTAAGSGQYTLYFGDSNSNHMLYTANTGACAQVMLAGDNAATATKINSNGSNTQVWSMTSGSTQGWANAGSGTPCTTTASSFQYDNAGAFGCEPDMTFNGTHTITFGASAILTFTAGATINGFPCSGLPSFTGDVTNSGCAMTVGKINGTAFSGTANDVVAFDSGGNGPLDSGIFYTNLVTQTSAPTANQICVYGGTSKVCTPTTTLPTAAEPAHTGDATNTAGSLAMTVGKVNGGAPPTSSNVGGWNGSAQPINEESDLGTITYNASGTTTFAAGSVFIAGGLVNTTHSTSTTFSPTGLLKWGIYTVKITQDSTGGGVTFTLGTGGTCSAWKIINSGAGAITLSTGANAIDVLTFTYDGTNCLGALGKGYS